jgi:2-C-methyl-D-erythritol 2,4-cyclodiphosphate synthase
VHAFSDDSTRPLVLGGVVLDGPGLGGHSDADVVTHAVADAILGAAGLDDLGTLFPASDERYRGASSIALLADVAGRVVASRLWIVNVDVVVAAERPPIGARTGEMAGNLREVLQVAREPMGEGVHVSVKAKRAEGLGAIGRAEGIGAWAVALVDRG